MSERTEKIISVLQKALAPELLAFEGEFGMVTIIRITVTPDMREARIFVSSSRRNSKLTRKLNALSGVLSQNIRRAFMQKRIPKLIFRESADQESMARLERLLEED